MKSLHDQIADSCIHHRAPMHHKTCSAGVNYRDLVGGPNFGWMARRPCVRNLPLTKQPVAKCDHCQWPNEQQIRNRLYEINQITQEHIMDPYVRLLKYFEYKHLPEHLQEVSKPFGELAQKMAKEGKEVAETMAGLRKLLEAKDCAVRSVL